MSEEVNNFMNQISREFSQLNQNEQAAKELFSLYQSYVKAGFNEEQALIITVQVLKMVFENNTNK